MNLNEVMALGALKDCRQVTAKCSPPFWDEQYEAGQTRTCMHEMQYELNLKYFPDYDYQHNMNSNIPWKNQVNEKIE